MAEPLLPPNQPLPEAPGVVRARELLNELHTLEISDIAELIWLANALRIIAQSIDNELSEYASHHMLHMEHEHIMDVIEAQESELGMYRSEQQFRETDPEDVMDRLLEEGSDE